MTARIDVKLGGAGFSLRGTLVPPIRWRTEVRRRLKRNLQKYRAGPLPCSPTRECGRGSVSAIFSVGAFRAARASKRFPRILQVPLKSAPQELFHAVIELETVPRADPRSCLPAPRRLPALFAHEEEARQEGRAGRLKLAPRRIADKLRPRIGLILAPMVPDRIVRPTPDPSGHQFLAEARP
jgi:hypothetical protein